MIDLETVYRESRAALVRRAAYLVDDAIDAEDVVQEAFLTAWTKREQWTDRGQPAKAWLYGITRMKAQSLVKTRSHQPVPADWVGDRTSPTAATVPRDLPCMADDGVAAQVAEVLVLAGLTQRERDAVTLRYLEGLTWSAVGARMGTTLGNAVQAGMCGMRKINVRHDTGHGGGQRVRDRVRLSEASGLVNAADPGTGAGTGSGMINSANGHGPGTPAGTVTCPTRGKGWNR